MGGCASKENTKKPKEDDTGFVQFPILYSCWCLMHGSMARRGSPGYLWKLYVLCTAVICILRSQVRNFIPVLQCFYFSIFNVLFQFLLSLTALSSCIYHLIFSINVVGCSMCDILGVDVGIILDTILIGTIKYYWTENC